MIVSGIPVSGGTAVGRLVVIGAPAPTELAAVGGDATGTSAEDRLAQLVTAVDTSRVEIAAIADEARERLGDDSAAIIELQLLVLDDPEWWDPIVDEVRSGSDPEAAVRSVTHDVAEVLGSLEDPYLRERSADVLDVGQRVADRLAGRSRGGVLRGLSGEVVVAAYELSPTDTLGLDLDVVRGIVTETGARTSHAAILARQLGIPAVVGAAGLLQAVGEGSLAVLDGDAGTCEINPEQHVVDGARTKAAGAPRRTVIDHPVATLDGLEIRVLANASSVSDVERAVAQGADGIGLYRTEFLFMGSPELPDEDAQAVHYAAVAAAASGRPVTFRTLDVGGDKPAPGLPLEPEENPFLGVRGIRLTLAHRPVFDAQLRALARTAAAYPGISVMIPMVSGLEELDEVREVLSEVVPGAHLRLGAMVEVPSAAVLVEEIAQEVDFLSVGTNDLTAYLLAADRGNRHLQSLYSEFHPAVLRALHQIGRGAGATPVSICGELAGDPRASGLLVGLGYRQLSVSGPLVPVVKDRVRRLDAAAAAAATDSVLRARRHRDVEAALQVLLELEG